MSIKSFRRYEKKFILLKSQYESLIPLLTEFMDYDEHCKNNSTYSIYNIYYDTENNDVIRHSISKPYYKEKLRLRSYKTEITADTKVFLELKKKINGIVNKRRVVITLKEANDFLYKGIRPKSNEYIDNQVIDELEYYLSNNKVHPNVYLCYKRSAFFSKVNRDFRLTFDSDIMARRYDVSLEHGEGGMFLLDKDKYLMEVKILGAMPLWFTNILSELEIYSSSFSKYGTEFMEYCKNYNECDRGNKVC